ncbi:MAG TPA: hypothetical protein VML96_02170 [Egibacteraceae bacterium]|nr:hypothetical protein [Egibacteraceae bacterium]
MSGPLGVMAVILLEAAAGGAAVLWAAGVWGAVRRGFFLLTGITIAVCALGAWAIARMAAATSDAPELRRAVLALGAFAGLAVLWQLALLVRQSALSRALGLAATAVGIVSLVLLGLARERDPLLGIAELALGGLFLGSTVYGLLLGHWYLVERRLPGLHMVRASWWYIAGVAAAVGAALLSVRNPPPEIGTGFSPMLAIPGFSVWLAGGLVAVCALISGFVWKLAQEGGRSIQAATGMFYLAVIMAFSAEMSSKLGFF